MMKAKEVVLAYAEALGKGDVATAFSHFSPNVVWYQPGSNRFSGAKQGSDAIGKMIGGMMDISQGTFALSPTGDLMVNGDLVAMPLRFTGKIADRNLDMQGIDLFKVEEGKITAVWLFSENQTEEDNFWGS